MRAIEEARLDSIRLAEAEKAAYEASNKFNIIVGAFITPEYAKAWAEEYRKQGYDTRIIRISDSKFELVVAESYDRFSKAVERLNQFQDTVDIDTWLYVGLELPPAGTTLEECHSFDEWNKDYPV